SISCDLHCVSSHRPSRYPRTAGLEGLVRPREWSPWGTPHRFWGVSLVVAPLAAREVMERVRLVALLPRVFVYIPLPCVSRRAVPARHCPVLIDRAPHRGGSRCSGTCCIRSEWSTLPL